MGFEDRETACVPGFARQDERVVRPYTGFLWTEFAPLRRNAISVFDNLVERASREMNEFGHKSESISQDRPLDSARDRVVAITPLSSGGDGSLPSTRR